MLEYECAPGMHFLIDCQVVRFPIHSNPEIGRRRVLLQLRPLDEPLGPYSFTHRKVIPLWRQNGL